MIVAELYRQYRTPLMSFVLRLTAGDRQQAEWITGDQAACRCPTEARVCGLAGRSLIHPRVHPEAPRKLHMSALQWLLKSEGSAVRPCP
jgi:hypothetical protein